MKKILFQALIVLCAAGAAAQEAPVAMEALSGVAPAPAEGIPVPAAPERAASRKYYTGDGLFVYKPDAVTKAADYTASIRAAGIEVLGSTILNREDGDRDLYYFMIEYVADITLKSEQQAGIPDKFRADFIHDDYRDGLGRAGFRVVRSGVRKEEGFFTAYCLYAQEDGDQRAVRGYVSMPRQTSPGLDASALFADNMNAAVSDLEAAGMPVIFRIRGTSGWTIKFLSAARPKRLRSETQASFTAALSDMRREVARLKGDGKIILDATTALVGSYWMIDYIEK